MKKLTISIATALALGAAQAEYVIKQPLEQAQGGSLPTGSIQFSTPNTTPPLTEQNEECIFDVTGITQENYYIGWPGLGDYIFITNYGYDVYIFIKSQKWGLNSMYSLPVFTTDSGVSPGYKYKQGQRLVDFYDSGWNHTGFYQICREPI